MSESSSTPSHLDASLAVDRLCDEFERAWKKRQNPRIENFLDSIDDSLKKRAFEQLLFLELDLGDKTPQLDLYTDRFPQFENLVRLVFEEAGFQDWKDQIIGPFRLMREIGRGGMGVVYLAKDSRLDRDVAIKLLNRNRRSNTTWLRRFRREARLASGLNHPNVLTIYEIGEHEGISYLASEFVSGKTLREHLSNRRLGLQEILEIASQIAKGMLAAHQSGIIHRDVKADNIMIRDDGLIKILDFGLAKEENLEGVDPSIESKTGAITGTVHFMSPEQARGRELDTATDVFSFGCLMYLMCTGQLPFNGQSISDVIAAILNSEPTAISQYAPELPISLVTLIESCLDKMADQRPTFEDVESSIESVRSKPSIPVEMIGDASDLLSGKETSFDTDPALGSATKINLQPSEIRYAQSGDVNIAWQEIGTGPIDIVFVMGWVSHLDWFWKDDSFAAFLQQLATFARVILFDKRGTGLSDKVPVKELPDLETRMDDVRAVMEAAASQQAVLCGISEGGPLCALFAATYPDRTLAITMIGSYSRRLWAEDYPWGPTAEQRETFIQEIAEQWGGPLGLEDRAPTMANDEAFRNWWASYLRMGASPGAAVALTKMNAQIDIRAILPSIHVPTLVIHRTGDRCLQVDEGKYLAEKIPGAKFVELPGDDHLPFVGDAQSVLNEIELFLTGMKSGSQADCVLATVMHIDVLDSQNTESVAQFQTLVKHEIALFRGKNFYVQEASLVVTFDGPVRSVLCASAIARLADRLNIFFRCGLETGTCNIDQSAIYGPAVSGARKVSELAEKNTILASQNLRHLIAGTELTFEPQERMLETELGQVQLFKVVD